MKYRDIFHVAYVDRMKLNCREIQPNTVWFRITEIFPMQSKYLRNVSHVIYFDQISCINNHGHFLECSLHAVLFTTGRDNSNTRLTLYFWSRSARLDKRTRTFFFYIY